MHFVVFIIVADNIIMKKTSSGTVNVLHNEVTISKEDVDVVKVISNGLFG